jgi:transcriptional regulator with XRE-family HTH domain
MAHLGDYANNIKRYREKNRLSQRQLAAIVGVSQQQIQRFETGTPVKLDVAVNLAASLKTSVEKLFPGSAKAVRKAKASGAPLLYEPYNRRDAPLLQDPDNRQELLAAGIEVDPERWTARVVIQGGDPSEPMLYEISVADKERACHVLKDDKPKVGFFVFDAGDRTVAINLDHLTFWQNCFDYTFPTEPEDNEAGDDEFSYAVHVYLAGVREPMVFPVEGDDEQDEDGFRSLFFELLPLMSDKDAYISFMDEDGEEAYFRVGDIALLEVAKDVTDPEPLDEEDSDVTPEPREPPATTPASVN